MGQFMQIETSWNSHNVCFYQQGMVNIICFSFLVDIPLIYIYSVAYALYIINSKINAPNNTEFVRYCPSLPADVEFKQEDTFRDTFLELLINTRALTLISDMSFAFAANIHKSKNNVESSFLPCCRKGGAKVCQPQRHDRFEPNPRCCIFCTSIQRRQSFSFMCLMISNNPRIYYRHTCDLSTSEFFQGITDDINVPESLNSGLKENQNTKKDRHEMEVLENTDLSCASPHFKNILQINVSCYLKPLRTRNKTHFATELWDEIYEADLFEYLYAKGIHKNWDYFFT